MVLAQQERFGLMIVRFARLAMCTKTNKPFHPGHTTKRQGTFTRAGGMEPEAAVPERRGSWLWAKQAGGKSGHSKTMTRLRMTCLAHRDARLLQY